MLKIFHRLAIKGIFHVLPPLFGIQVGLAGGGADAPTAKRVQGNAQPCTDVAGNFLGLVKSAAEQALMMQRDRNDRLRSLGYLNHPLRQQQAEHPGVAHLAPVFQAVDQKASAVLVGEQGIQAGEVRRFFLAGAAGRLGLVVHFDAAHRAGVAHSGQALPAGRAQVQSRCSGRVAQHAARRVQRVLYKI